MKFAKYYILSEIKGDRKGYLRIEPDFRTHLGTHCSFWMNVGVAKNVDEMLEVLTRYWETEECIFEQIKEGSMCSFLSQNMFHMNLALTDKMTIDLNLYTGSITVSEDNGCISSDIFHVMTGRDDEDISITFEDLRFRSDLNSIESGIIKLQMKEAVSCFKMERIVIEQKASRPVEGEDE